MPVQIDPRLTRGCDKPELKGDTWRDVGVLAVEQKAAIDECSERMRAIRGQSRGEAEDS